MLSEKLRDSGVVGAGGAGFPTYIKAQSQVEFLIANGAECEPLIHKDAELMKHFPAGILAGMTSMMDATGAKTGKFGIKTKSAESLEALKHNLHTDRIEFVMLGDFYPSGDEYELVYTWPRPFRWSSRPASYRADRVETAEAPAGALNETHQRRTRRTTGLDRCAMPVG